MIIPTQIPRCACRPDYGEYDACHGEFYSCEACGAGFDDPLPYAEPMESPGLDLKEASSWFYYCRRCAFEWILDGADVRRAVAA